MLNSWIAPHNFEGFFLNMGDMLVKAGDWATAQKIYANAKLSSTYAGWKYRAVLESRIEQAQANVAAFNAPARGQGPGDAVMMVQSRFACWAATSSSGDGAHPLCGLQAGRGVVP